MKCESINPNQPRPHHGGCSVGFEQERKEREAEVSRKRELKKAELAQKWSKREEQDFGRIVSYFGIEYEEGSNKYDWTHFRQLANLGKKTDDRLTLYFHDFKEMCRRVIKRKRPKMDGGERENSDSEDEGTGEEEQKTKPSFAIIPNNTTPVPLGWPKEKAVAIRISRIIFAFRNKVWPKPMEGLDLFNPVPALTEEDSSSSPSPSPSYADSDEDINSDYASDEDYSIEEETAPVGGQRSKLRTQKRHQADSPLTISLSPSLSAKSLVGNSSLDDSLQTPKFQVQKQQG
uniref:Chromodomain-helicase-DNA-binding protein 6-9 tri-helical domain-containing protein n=1 Tax=Amphimedon queenslandica TaxID=400682 RepID=A0A1X7T521_AMPQE